MNPATPAFGLAHFWAQGDAISHGVTYALLLMSIASWYTILSKAWSSWRIRRSARSLDGFWQAPSLDDAAAALGSADPEKIYTPLASQAVVIASKGEATASLDASTDPADLITRALRREIQRSTARLESGLTLLASIGATAPFIGLFGTVWGIYHALGAISMAGAAQIDRVVGPVGEALVMTALGLAVAIPAVLAYNAFTRVNRLTQADLDGFAHDLRAWLMARTQK